MHVQSRNNRDFDQVRLVNIYLKSKKRIHESVSVDQLKKQVAFFLIIE